MVDLKKLRDNANSIDKSITAARLYNDKKAEADLIKSQLIILKLAQHLENSFFNESDIKKLELDIAGALS